MVSIVMIVAVSILLLLLFLFWKYSYWYRRGIPQGNPFKLLGDLNDVGITFQPFLKHYLTLGRKFGDKPYYGVYGAGCPRLYIRDSEMIKDILTRRFSSFSENGFAVSEEIEPIIGRDPFFQKGGEKWKESRANFTSLMTPARLRNIMLPEMLTVSDEAVNYLKELEHQSGQGDGANVKDLSLRYMVNILIRVILSEDAGCFKAEKSPFLQKAENIINTVLDSLIRNLSFLLAPTLRVFLRQDFIPKDTEDFFKEVIDKQKNYREENAIKRDDILNTIMKKTHEIQVLGSKPVDADLEILALVIMFFTEGFETTSTTLSAAMVCLAKHEDIQENLRREILNACPRGKALTEEALNNIPLLQNCISETLRMYPVGFFMQRIVTEDVTLRAKTGEELPLKEGECVQIPIISIQRDPDFFPNPQVFDPDRFQDDIQKRNLLTFGDGPRQCPGQKFATLAIKVMIASILREFKLELSPKTKYPIVPMNNPRLFMIRDVRVRFVPL